MLEATQIMANIAGVVAAIGVMVSLIYLAIQVRDNSRLVSENTKAQLMAGDLSSNDGNRELFMEALVKDPDLAALILRGYSGEELSEIDRFRFETWARMTVESHMTFFVLLERGTVTGEIFEYWSHSFDRLLRLPTFVDVYKKMRKDLKPSFREYMDKKTPPEFGLHVHSNERTDSTKLETVSPGAPA